MIEYRVLELPANWGALELEEILNHCAADGWLLDSHDAIRAVFVRSNDE